jgi:hypothetical protein
VNLKFPRKEGVDGLKYLIQMMLSENPDGRPTINEALAVLSNWKEHDQFYK